MMETHIVTGPNTPSSVDGENITSFSPPSPILSETSSTSTQTKRANSRLSRWLSYSQFIVQTLFSALILFFCILKLSISNSMDAGEKTIYFSLISGIIGYWLPAPKLPSASKTQF